MDHDHYYNVTSPSWGITTGGTGGTTTTGLRYSSSSSPQQQQTTSNNAIRGSASPLSPSTTAPTRFSMPAPAVRWSGEAAGGRRAVFAPSLSPAPLMPQHRGAAVAGGGSSRAMQYNYNEPQSASPQSSSFSPNSAHHLPLSQSPMVGSHRAQQQPYQQHSSSNYYNQQPAVPQTARQPAFDYHAGSNYRGGVRSSSPPASAYNYNRPPPLVAAASPPGRRYYDPSPATTSSISRGGNGTPKKFSNNCGATVEWQVDLRHDVHCRWGEGHRPPPVTDSPIWPSVTVTYRCGALLGKGGFAEVFEFEVVSVRRCSNGADLFSEPPFAGFEEAFSPHVRPGGRVACKIVEKVKLTTASKAQKLKSEIDIHRRVSQINSPGARYIVAFFDSFSDGRYTYILMERLARKSLLDVSKENRGTPFPMAALQHIMSQVFSAVSFLHNECSIVHRDLKLGNLMIDNCGSIKVGDFGFAAELLHEQEKKRTMCGTPNYMAPEIVASETTGAGYNGRESDVWSLGCILYTLACGGKPPFETENLHTTYGKIRRGEYKFPPGLRLDPTVKEMIERMLQVNPKQRPTLIELRALPFFNCDGYSRGPPRILVGLVENECGPTPSPTSRFSRKALHPPTPPQGSTPMSSPIFQQETSPVASPLPLPPAEERPLGGAPQRHDPRDNELQFLPPPTAHCGGADDELEPNYSPIAPMPTAAAGAASRGVSPLMAPAPVEVPVANHLPAHFIVTRLLDVTDRYGYGYEAVSARTGAVYFGVLYNDKSKGLWARAEDGGEVKYWARVREERPTAASAAQPQAFWAFDKLEARFNLTGCDSASLSAEVVKKVNILRYLASFVEPSAAPGGHQQQPATITCYPKERRSPIFLGGAVDGAEREEEESVYVKAIAVDEGYIGFRLSTGSYQASIFRYTGVSAMSLLRATVFVDSSTDSVVVEQPRVEAVRFPLSSFADASPPPTDDPLRRTLAADAIEFLQRSMGLMVTCQCR